MSAAAVARGGTDWLPIIVPAVLTFVFGGGLVAMRRGRDEGSKLIVDAAQGAVIVQSGVIDSLQEQLAEAKQEIEQLRKSFAEVEGLRGRVRELEHENQTLRSQGESLRSQNAALAARVQELERKTQ